MPPRNTDVLSGNGSAQPIKSLIVEGWRFLAHSYAMVNQWQLLAISRRPDISLKVIDVPFRGQRWRTQEGLFELPSERILQELETAKPEESADVTSRMSFPYNFAASPSRQNGSVRHFGEPSDPALNTSPACRRTSNCSGRCLE